MNDWFRSWHGAPTDPKWLLIAKRANVRPIHVIGTWWALLDYASQHSDRGSIEGFDTETFALFAGLEDEHVSRIVTTLRDKRMIVDGRISNWAKRQPKREDETAAKRQREHRANKPKNGGNPPPGGTPDTPDGTTPDDRHAMSRNVTPDKTRLETETDNSVAKATGTAVPHPAADFCKAVFDSGAALLVASGETERNARSIVGRWRKACGDAELLTIIRNSEIEGHSDPVGWIMAAVETRNGTRQSSAKPLNLSGSRPSPALAMWRQAEAELAAENPGGGEEPDSSTWTALPSFGPS
jgi:hypothetical protein